MVALPTEGVKSSLEANYPDKFCQFLPIWEATRPGHPHARNRSPSEWSRDHSPQAGEIVRV